MATSDYIDLPLLTSPQTDMSCTESHHEMSSPIQTVILIPNSTLPVSNIASSKKMNGVTNEDEHAPLLPKKRRSTRPVSMANVSHRLVKRKILHHRLCLVNDVMCFLGLMGIILMIIENEITFMNVYNRETLACSIIKLTITITTVCLVALVFYYHQLDLSLYVVNNSLDDWSFGLTYKRVISILFEVLICAIHPVPRSFSLISNPKYTDSTPIPTITPSYVDIDVALGLPMFARMYLVCRFATFHSHLMHNVSAQSLGYLNEVSINFSFLIKTYLEQWPIRCLLIFCTFTFLIGSWSLRACSYYPTAEHMLMLDSMWLFIVTFTTVGYGDITPSSYCGRSVAAVMGLIGVISTALLISVLSQKLQLTRSEKYVHYFVSNIEFAKEQNNQAANVVKFAVRIWYLQRKSRQSCTEYNQAQRKLFHSIHRTQRLRHEQKKLIDGCLGLPEIIIAQREVSDKAKENTQRLTTMEMKVDNIEEKLTDISQTMNNINTALHLLLNRMTQYE